MATRPELQREKPTDGGALNLGIQPDEKAPNSANPSRHSKFEI